MKNNYISYPFSIIDHNYWTNSVGLARSLLALSTLLTLLFNDEKTLFYTGILKLNKGNLEKVSLNIFTWFPSLEYGIWFSIIILILILIGIYPRITCFFHWLVTYSFYTMSVISDGGDQIASIITLLLIPILVFDKRKWHWSKKRYKHSFYEKTIAGVFRYLINLQVFVIYFFAAIGKFPIEEWRNGTAIYYWLREPLFGVRYHFEPFIDTLLKIPFIVVILTWFVLIIELFLAYSFLSANIKIRKSALIFGIIFHVCILIFLGLVSFSMVMTAALILYLTPKSLSYEWRNFDFINPFRNKSYILFGSTSKD